MRVQDVLKQGKRGILLTNIKHPEIKIDTKVYRGYGENSSVKG